MLLEAALGVTGRSIDASASAVAVKSSAQASAGTQGTSTSADGGGGGGGTAASTSYYAGMQTFTMAEGGLMYAATIGGQRYNFKAVK